MTTISWSQQQTDQRQRRDSVEALEATTAIKKKQIAFVDEYFVDEYYSPTPATPSSQKQQARSTSSGVVSVAAMVADPTPHYFMDSPTEGDRLELKTDPYVVGQQLMMTGLQHDMSALDVGCGSGAVARVMAQIAGSGRVTGVDASQDRLDQAQRRAAEQHVSITWTQGASFHLPFADNQFDYTHARMLFQYLAEPLTTLKEMARVTKPGGYVVVSDLDNQLVNLYPMAEEVHCDLETALSLLAKEGFDPYVGRKLYSYFGEVNLSGTQVWTLPYQVYYGGQLPLRDKLNWEEKLQTATGYLAKVTGDTQRWQRFRNAYLETLMAPQAYYASTQVLVKATINH